MNKYTACFTGHRNINKNMHLEISHKLILIIKNLISKGVYQFLNGGARGFDLLAGECVLSLKEEYPQLELSLILPCKEQTKGWNKLDIIKYEKIFNLADKILYISDKYHKRCMLDRNDYLIEKSDYCIAYLTQKRGGTFYTVRRAENKGLQVYNIAYE